MHGLELNLDNVNQILNIAQEKGVLEIPCQYAIILLKSNWDK